MITNEILDRIYEYLLQESRAEYKKPNLFTQLRIRLESQEDLIFTADDIVYLAKKITDTYLRTFEKNPPLYMETELSQILI